MFAHTLYRGRLHVSIHSGSGHWHCQWLDYLLSGVILSSLVYFGKQVKWVISWPLINLRPEVKTSNRLLVKLSAILPIQIHPISCEVTFYNSSVGHSRLELNPQLIYLNMLMKCSSCMDISSTFPPVDNIKYPGVTAHEQTCHFQPECLQEWYLLG